MYQDYRYPNMYSTSPVNYTSHSTNMFPHVNNMYEHNKDDRFFPLGALLLGGVAGAALARPRPVFFPPMPFYGVPFYRPF